MPSPMTLSRLAVGRWSRLRLRGRPCSATHGGSTRSPGSVRLAAGWSAGVCGLPRSRGRYVGLLVGGTAAARAALLGRACARSPDRRLLGTPPRPGSCWAAGRWAGRPARPGSWWPGTSGRAATDPQPRGPRSPALDADGAGPGQRRVGGREHLRRRGRAAVLGRGRRPSGSARLPGREHARRHGRAPLERYLRFGWAAARLDDVLNWLPARLSGAARSGRPGGGSPWPPVRADPPDARRHPSPNAGVVEAAFAGALGVQLGGRTSTTGRPRTGACLARGRSVEVGDIARASRLADGSPSPGCGRRAGPRWPAMILILGGTGEARALAAVLIAGALACCLRWRGGSPIPRCRPGVRIGGFGGIDGLRDFLPSVG